MVCRATHDVLGKFVYRVLRDPGFDVAGDADGELVPGAGASTISIRSASGGNMEASYGFGGNLQTKGGTMIKLFTPCALACSVTRISVSRHNQGPTRQECYIVQHTCRRGFESASCFTKLKIGSVSLISPWAQPPFSEKAPPPEVYFDQSPRKCCWQ